GPSDRRPAEAAHPLITPWGDTPQTPNAPRSYSCPSAVYPSHRNRRPPGSRRSLYPVGNDEQRPGAVRAPSPLAFPCARRSRPLPLTPFRAGELPLEYPAQATTCQGQEKTWCLTASDTAARWLFSLLAHQLFSLNCSLDRSLCWVL